MTHTLYNLARPTGNDLASIRNAIADRLTRSVFRYYDEAHSHIFTAWSVPQQKVVIKIKYGDTIYAFELDEEIEQEIDKWVEKVWAMESTA
jgi:hypothetical protein